MAADVAVASAPAAPPPRRLSRARFAVFALIAVTLSAVAGLALLLGADLYLHKRAERSAGMNLWGYRGQAVGGKAAHEVRIAFLGGSTMFGYGVTWDQAIPALVERELTTTAAPVRAVNLGMNNAGAYSFLFTLQDYDYLDADIVVLYEGYNDLQGEEWLNTSLLRHESAVFRLTGYYPILPLALQERAMLLRYGDFETAYAVKRGETPARVFTPGLAQRSAATALDAARSVSESVGRQIDRLSPGSVATDTRTEAGCAARWASYCQWVYRAIQHALRRGQRVAVGSQPTATAADQHEKHVSQQAALQDMLQRHFAGDPRVVRTDLRAAIDLRDRALSFDAMHLTEAGNQIAAARMAADLRPLVEAVRSARAGGSSR